jgi:hypothetical protein
VKSSDRGHIAPVTRHCPFQCGGGRSRRREQRFDKAPGLAGIKADLIALIDDLAGNHTDVRNNKGSHRASLNRGRLLEKLFICRRQSRGKSLTFLLFSYRLHAPNVCLCGTHRKD